MPTINAKQKINKNLLTSRVSLLTERTTDWIPSKLENSNSAWIPPLKEVGCFITNGRFTSRDYIHVWTSRMVHPPLTSQSGSRHSEWGPHSDLAKLLRSCRNLPHSPDRHLDALECERWLPSKSNVRTTGPRARSIKQKQQRQ